MELSSPSLLTKEDRVEKAKKVTLPSSSKETKTEPQPDAVGRVEPVVAEWSAQPTKIVVEKKRKKVVKPKDEQETKTKARHDNAVAVEPGPKKIELKKKNAVKPGVHQPINV